MSTSKQRDLSKERFWRRTVQQWRKSGLSARAFCRRHALSEPSFYAWRRTLEQRDAQAARLVPVRVIPEAASAGDRGAALAGLELIVAGGQRLRIGPGFDSGTLRRLLAVLEEGRPCC